MLDKKFIFQFWSRSTILKIQGWEFRKRILKITAQTNSVIPKNLYDQDCYCYYRVLTNVHILYLFCNYGPWVL